MLSSTRTGLLSRSVLLRGLEQIDSVIPSSTTRRPGNKYLSLRRSGGTNYNDLFPMKYQEAGRATGEDPAKRKVSPKERQLYDFVKKWDLQMKGEWDEFERFRHLPKPKKQFGNEAAELIWPYALLLQNKLAIHPYTKSIYCYYPHKTLTARGGKAQDAARRFAQRCLVPLTFHNSQCYCETEMLLEHGDTPWIVVHCLDGRHKIVPVDNSIFNNTSSSSSSSTTQSADNAMTTTTTEKTTLMTAELENSIAALLASVQAAATELGESVTNPRAVKRIYNERPPQNQYVRVDYQWMAETEEERAAHTVQWVAGGTSSNEDERIRAAMPTVRNRDAQVMTWLNEGLDWTLSPAARGSVGKSLWNEKKFGQIGKMVAGHRPAESSISAGVGMTGSIRSDAQNARGGSFDANAVGGRR